MEDVYEVSREGEEQRYAEKLQQIPDLAANRKLLWHGSRLTNYVGIISQGLKIAPVWVRWCVDLCQLPPYVIRLP